MGGKVNAALVWQVAKTRWPGGQIWAVPHQFWKSFHLTNITILISYGILRSLSKELCFQKVCALSSTEVPHAHHIFTEIHQRCDCLITFHLPSSSIFFFPHHFLRWIVSIYEHQTITPQIKDPVPVKRRSLRSTSRARRLYSGADYYHRQSSGSISMQSIASGISE